MALSNRLELPGVRRFLHVLVEDLADGASVFVVVPQHGASLFAAAIQEPQFLTSDRYDVDLPTIAGRESPVVDELYEMLGLRRDRAGEILTAGTLAFHPHLGKRLVVADGMSSGPQELDRWSKFVAEYAAIAKEVSTRNRTIFLTIVAPEAAEYLPDKDLNLKHRWWWGVVRRLDTMAYVEGAVNRSEEDLDVIVEVARFDLDLADRLLSSWNGTMSQLRELIADYAPSGKTLETTLPSTHERPSERPSPQVLDAWSAGIVEWWQGLERHVCAEAASDETAVQRSVWVAQVRALFPRIELERRRIAQWVAANEGRVGSAWSARDFESLEIGPLATLIRESSSLKTPGPRRKLVDWLAGARNRLAHGKTIDTDELKRGLGLIARDHRETTVG